MVGLQIIQNSKVCPLAAATTNKIIATTIINPIIGANNSKIPTKRPNQSGAVIIIMIIAANSRMKALSPF